MQIYEKKQYGQLRTIKNPSLRSFWKRAAGDAAAGSYLWLTPGGYNEETGLKLGIIYLDHLSAKLFSMSGSVKDIMAY